MGQIDCSIKNEGPVFEKKKPPEKWLKDEAATVSSTILFTLELIVKMVLLLDMTNCIT